MRWDFFCGLEYLGLLIETMQARYNFRILELQSRQKWGDWHWHWRRGLCAICGPSEVLNVRYDSWHQRGFLYPYLLAKWDFSIMSDFSVNSCEKISEIVVIFQKSILAEVYGLLLRDNCEDACQSMGLGGELLGFHNARWFVPPEASPIKPLGIEIYGTGPKNIKRCCAIAMWRFFWELVSWSQSTKSMQHLLLSDSLFLWLSYTECLSQMFIFEAYSVRQWDFLSFVSSEIVSDLILHCSTTCSDFRIVSIWLWVLWRWHMCFGCRFSFQII